MSRRLATRITIRRQLAALVLVVVLPLLGALAYGAHETRVVAEERAERVTTQLAKVTSASVEHQIADARRRLEMLSTRPLIRRLDPQRCDPILRVALLFNPYTANVNTLDLDGQVVCSARPAPPEGLPRVADTEWFQRVRATDAFTVGEPFRGRITGKMVGVLILPIKDDGRTIGYVDAPFDLVRFQEFFARLAGPSGATIALATDRGLVVARSHDADGFVGTQLSADALAQLNDPPGTATGADGVERVSARIPVPGTPWIVSAGVPTAVAYGPTDALRNALLAVTAALLALSLLAATLTGRWIAGPVQRLARRAQDLTERRAASEEAPRAPHEVAVAAGRLDELVAELGEAERRLGRALDAADMGAWAADLDSGQVWRSARHDSIYGHDEPVPGWSLETTLAHIVPDDRPLYERRLAEALRNGGFTLEYRIALADGSERWLRTDGRVEHGDDGRPLRIAGTVADITDRVRSDAEREQLEGQLRQSQKMDAVGQLAGGIAHDFNNLLTAICGYSDFALARLDHTDTELRADIEEIARAGERAAQLTRQLLAFSRRETLQTTVFDLNDAVSESRSLLQRLLGAHIDVRSSPTREPCTIAADRGQIEQILMNLAVNARDAMPDGGTLTLATERCLLDGREARLRFEAPAGEYVLLRVADDGVGMAAETRARVFEPFFTTKGPGEGTGLGLATVFGIVRQCAGFIAVASEPGAGTTFEILLPPVAEPAAPPDEIAGSGQLAGTERILLVEDDAMVRALTREILVGKGYDVVAAEDGEEALTLFREHPVDLVLTDMVMPKLHGRGLAAELRRVSPALPIVFMSGYAHDVGGEDLTDGDGFVQKPFAALDLTRAIRTALEAGRIRLATGT